MAESAALFDTSAGVAAIDAVVPQELILTVQQPVARSSLSSTAVYILSWVLWGYVWCMISAVSIFFIRTNYDIIATLEHLLIIAIYPITEVVMLFYRECIIPCYCLMDAMFFDLIDKITFWSKSEYSEPDKCGGKNSVYCQATPHPKFMSEAWYLCGHSNPPAGGQCTVACNNSNLPGYSSNTPNYSKQD